MMDPITWGPTRFYFPESPDNKFNGCSAKSCGEYTGEIINGLQCRDLITTYPLNEYNKNNYPWEGELIIITSNPILVIIWSDIAEKETERFYLMNK